MGGAGSGWWLGEDRAGGDVESERGNPEWSWYVDRFDRDGDGVLCE